jgi:hypothetical protein
MRTLRSLFSEGLSVRESERVPLSDPRLPLPDFSLRAAFLLGDLDVRLGDLEARRGEREPPPRQGSFRAGLLLTP